MLGKLGLWSLMVMNASLSAILQTLLSTSRFLAMAFASLVIEVVSSISFFIVFGDIVSK